MKITPPFILSLAAILFFFHGAESATFTVTNNCAFTIWPGILTGTGPALSTTGFELTSNNSLSIDVPRSWSGRMWARTGCTAANDTFKCVTGDCGSNQVQCNGAGGIPPVSLAEFTIAPSTGGKDFFDISLVDGFDLPLSITPQGGEAGCYPVSCAADVNAVCPPELQVKGPDGVAAVGCKSACLAFNKPEYCCTGEYATPDKCPPSNYSLIFKNQCPQAYAYAYDDKTALASCSGGASYTITFCP